LRNEITVRLAQGSQLRAAISPQSLVPFYAQTKAPWGIKTQASLRPCGEAF
jgi:hypothetical protein